MEGSDVILSAVGQATAIVPPPQHRQATASEEALVAAATWKQLPRPSSSSGLVYNFHADNVVQFGDVSYALGDEIGAGAFGKVYRVELLVAAFTELAVQEEDGRPMLDEAGTLTMRVAPDCELSQVDLDRLVGTGFFYALKVAQLPNDSNKAIHYKALLEYEACLLGQLKGLPHVVSIERFEIRDTYCKYFSQKVPRISISFKNCCFC